MRSETELVEIVQVPQLFLETVPAGSNFEDGSYPHVGSLETPRPIRVVKRKRRNNIERP